MRDNNIWLASHVYKFDSFVRGRNKTHFLPKKNAHLGSTISGVLCFMHILEATTSKLFRSPKLPNYSLIFAIMKAFIYN